MNIPTHIWNLLGGLFSGNVTNPRLKVDSQQASFEDNKQFQFFDSIEGLADNQFLIYRITIGANPINLFWRDFNLWEGGRTYRAYPLTDGTNTVSFAQTMEDISEFQIFPVNGNLVDSGLSEHPESGVTIERYIGTSNITANGVLPFAGTSCVSSTGGGFFGGGDNGSTYSPSGIRQGVKAGAVTYVVIAPVASTDDSNGEFTLLWEERL